jgi:outer membrane protein assembly factor BamB
MLQAPRRVNVIALAVVVVLGGATWIYARWSRFTALPRPKPISAASAGSRETSEMLSDSAEAGWPCLFGPNSNSTSGEVGIAADWPATGPRVLWRGRVGEGYSSPVALGDDVVLFHRPRQGDAPAGDNHGPVETLTCFDLSTGRPRWQFSSPTNYRCKTHYSSGPYSTPVIDADRAYAWGTEGTLYCLGRSDGALLWQRDLWREFDVQPTGYFPPAGSPLLVDDRLIVNLGAADSGAGIIALNKRDGRTLWTGTQHRAGYATPCAATIHGRSFVFVFTADGLVALDPQSGSEHWQIPFRANNPELVNATSPIVHQDIVFTSGYSLGSLCIQVQPDGSYKELWRDKRRNLDSQYNPLICIDGWVYGFAALDDTLRCINLRTGDLAWKGLRELERGTAITVEQQLIVLGTRGHLASVRIDPRRLNVLAQTKDPVLAAPAYSLLALHRGRLLVRNESELVCFDLRAGEAPATSP